MRTTSMTRVLLVLVVAMLYPFGAAIAADESTKEQSYVEWLNDYLVNRVRVATATRSNANQSETPSVSENSTTLIDTSSASDLIGIALNAAGLSKHTNDTADHHDATSGSATVSAYALWAAATGSNPLDPAVYCGSSALGPAKYWRRVSFTVGFDDQKHDASTNGPIVAGAKAILITERDICEADLHEVKDALRRRLSNATGRTVVNNKLRNNMNTTQQEQKPMD